MELCQPPRSVINQPKLRVPHLACDCHAHIVGPPVKNLAVPEDALREYAAWLELQRDAGRLQVGTVDQLVRRNVLA